MNIWAAVICVAMIFVAAVLLFRKYNPQGVLIFSGLIMVAVAAAMGLNSIAVAKPTGSGVFDLIAVISDKFISNLSRAGLMIMTIGGYVAFMNKIQATDVLVRIAIRPLSFLKKYPYLASVCAIPIGQVLFMTTPSAAGIGLLLVASLYPVLVNLGVSRLTALSVISAATLFDQGPGSANTALASELIEMPTVEYFISHQVPLVVPTTIFIMVLYYFTNRYFDKKDLAAGKQIYAEPLDETVKIDAPKYFAIFPLMPLIILVLFSDYVNIFDIRISTTIAMLVSLVISFLFLIIYKKSLRKAFDILSEFWKGMGNVFASVVTLIVAAEIFSTGLINLGFIDSLVFCTTHIGLGGIAISILITIIIFLAAMLMGSGNAAFFSFGPLMPSIAGQLGLQPVVMTLPMQLSSSMGRAVSPISGVIVAIAGVAGVSAADLVKRNMIPLFGGIIFLMLYHFLFLN